MLAQTLAVAMCVLPPGCAAPTPSVGDERPASEDSARVEGPIAPLPREAPPQDPQHVALGRQLFFDPLLSPDGRTSCSTCHDPARAGTDGLVHSALAGRDAGGVNVPTIYNLAYVFRYSWSGRFDAMNEIMEIAVQSRAAMATTWRAAADRLADSPEHRAAFARVFPDGVTEDNVKTALAAYLLSLTTPDAPFDRYLRREEGAISDEAREGYELFREYGCASCHQGVNVGGNMYQRFGVMRDYFADRGNESLADQGLWIRTHEERDRHVFRVPSLRNVALTAPYFHDGTAETLEDAIETMARYQLGRPLRPEDVARLVAFLESLTGEIDPTGS